MFHVSTMLPYTPNNKQQVRAAVICAPLTAPPPEAWVCKLCSQNGVLHLSQQQGALCSVEAVSSEWAENKWKPQILG